MPTFGGYVVWTFMYLVPTLVAMVLIFLAEGWLWTVLGVGLAVGLLARAVWLARSHVHPTERVDAGADRQARPRRSPVR